jgi:membrane protease subunit HflC
MKRNSLTIIVGILLLVIFGLLLFTFQVRQTEIALVTTFDKPSRFITEPGFALKWPPPIQRVIKFDKRVQTLDPQDKIEQTLTGDGFNLVVQVYLGWNIKQPDLFFSAFPSGSVTQAQPALEDLIGTAKSEVVGKHPFVHFVSTDPKELKFDAIEKEMLDKVQPVALNKYGIDVKFLGIKALRLPDSVTQKVFDRMAEERKKEQKRLESQGQADATKIKSEAEMERGKILAKADADALNIKGEADAEAAKFLAIEEQEPELAKFLYKLRALEQIGKEKTAYFLDPHTSPFDLLTTNFSQRASSRPFPSLATNGAPPILEGKVTNGAFPIIEGKTSISKYAP